MNKIISSHTERMEICLSGEKPDHVPVAFWRHFPVDDQKGETLAAATLSFQKNYDFDFIKVTPSSTYCVKDWGVESRWIGNLEGTRDITKRLITSPEDWLKLPVLNPNHGSLKEMITCLKILQKELSGYTPFVQTIFSPMSQAKNLLGKEGLLVHLRKYPEQLKTGLKIITQSTLNFIEKARKTGISGIFLAVQYSQYSLLSESEFEIFAKPYNLQILEAVQDLWLNIAHIHGLNVMFDQVKDFPVQILNWHDQETPPSLSAAKENFSGVVCGGIRQEETMMLGTPQQVRDEAFHAIQETNGIRFVLGTGCVTPIVTPHGNIQSAINCARNTEI